MLIRCPQCKLERDIDATVIPPNAVMATCPGCKAKFRFRDPETPGTAGAADAASSAGVAGAAGAVGAPGAAGAAGTQSHATAQPVSSAPSAETPTQAAKDDEPEKPFAVPVRLGEPAAKRADRPAEAPDSKADSEAPAGTPLRAAPPKGESAENSEDMWLDVPFERPDRYGNLMGLYQTIVRVMFNAPKFFAAVPRCRGSIMRALLFYVLLGLFQVLIKLLWFSSIDPSMTDPQVQELISSTDMTLAMTFIVSPVILALQAFFYSALFFLMFRLVQPEASNFPVIFRVVAYSSAPMVICAVPVIGPLVAMLWFALSCFVGCRFALNLPWHKVALALIPLYLIGFAVTMQFVQHLLSQG